MANAVIKHFRRYEYLISNDFIALPKTKAEITSAFSGSLRISINRKKMTSARALEMCQKSIDFRVLSIIGTQLEKMFENGADIQVYSPGAGADNPLGSNFFNYSIIQSI